MMLNCSHTNLFIKDSDHVFKRYFENLLIINRFLKASRDQSNKALEEGIGR